MTMADAYSDSATPAAIASRPPSPAKAALLFSLPGASRAAEPQTFSVLLVGNPAGTMTLDQSDDRATIAWAFNDRGRGPDITAAWTLDEAGWPLSLAVSGVDYMKAEVNESLETKSGVRSWKSAADSGSVDVAGLLREPRWSGGGTVAARACADTRRGPCLAAAAERRGPAGIGTKTFDNGLELEQVEINGLGFEPETLWLDDQGRLFAIVSGWLAVVPEGQEDLVPTLDDIQKVRRKARFRAIAERARTIPDRPVLIDNARIFDVASGTVLDANAVVVDGDDISALLAPGDPRPRGAMTVDAKGRTLLPGLWDMHTHLDLADGPLDLAAGITTVRDLGNDHEQLMSVIEAFDNGDTVGPHVLRAGLIDGTGPYAGPTKARVETMEEATKWIDFYAAHGYQQIKIYSSVPVDLVPGMARHAHELGLRVSGHIPVGMWADQAVLAGYDEIQHVNMLFLNFYRDIAETRNPDRFIKVAERGADLKTDAAPSREFTQLLLRIRAAVA